MRKNIPTKTTFSISRTGVLYCLVILMVLVFASRLFYLQVVKHQHYVDLAAERQTRRWVLPATRGEIYFMNNGTPTPAVLNRSVYTVWIDPAEISEEYHSEFFTALSEIAGGNLLKNYKSQFDKKDTRYQVIAKGLTHKQAEMLKAKELYGLGFERSFKRVYPEGQVGSQVLGFVDNDSIGRYGVEGYMNEQLSGEDGLIKTVADVRNVPLTIGSENIKIPSKDGENLVLSIDRTVQSKTENILKKHIEEIGAEKASAVIMNPKNGQVIAMANYPSYDPTKMDSIEDISVLNNAVTAIPYEPGSVIKMFTMSVAIDQGKLNADSIFYNSDSVKVGDKTIKNATLGNTGNITMQTALDWSLNTGFVYALSVLGNNGIDYKARSILYDYFHNKYKLADVSGIEVAGESGGIIISPDEVEGNAVRYSNMSFGQGMNVTMLAVASGFCSIVNDGQYYKPTVIAGQMVNGQYVANNTTSAQQIISKESANATKKMAHDARDSFVGHGDLEGYYIGGKTGTSQVLKNGDYVFEETVASYLGFGGEVNGETEYVIMVQVSGENMNLHGSKHAMPIFTDISNMMIKHLKLQPK